MRNLSFFVTDFLSLIDLDAWTINKSSNPGGVYVLAPFHNPYYTGETIKAGRGIYTRVKEHLDRFKSDKCEYVIFDLSFYKAFISQRNKMIPRIDWPTNPAFFPPFAKDNVLFWREKVGFMNPNDLFHPHLWRLPLSNIKYPLKQEVLNVIHEVFSLQNFRFFFIEVVEEDLENNKAFLKCLEYVVKYSLKMNTASDSINFNKVYSVLNSLGISHIQINFHNPDMKSLFYPYPHDANHNPVTALQGMVTIT